MSVINENLCHRNKLYNIWKDENKFIRCFTFYLWVKGVWYWLVVGTTAINGAPPSVLSPTALAGFQIPQHNGQTPEMYANGIPHYPGECQVVELGMTDIQLYIRTIVKVHLVTTNYRWNLSLTWLKLFLILEKWIKCNIKFSNLTNV